MPSHPGAPVHICATSLYIVRVQMSIRTHIATHIAPYKLSIRTSEHCPNQQSVLLPLHSPTLRGCNQPPRHQGDSNPSGQRPIYFESISFTTRAQCHNRQRKPHFNNAAIALPPRHHGNSHGASIMNWSNAREQHGDVTGRGSTWVRGAR